MEPQNAVEAVTLIEELKRKFDLKGMIWGDAEIISILDEENAEHGAHYSPANYPQIVKEVKESKEWHALNTTFDSSDVWIALGPIVRKIANGIQTLEDELGTAVVTLADFSDEQLETYAANKHQKDDAYLGHLMHASPAKVRGLRKYMDEVLADMRRIPGLLVQK